MNVCVDRKDEDDLKAKKADLDKADTTSGEVKDAAKDASKSDPKPS